MFDDLVIFEDVRRLSCFRSFDDLVIFEDVRRLSCFRSFDDLVIFEGVRQLSYIRFSKATTLLSVLYISCTGLLIVCIMNNDAADIV